MTPPVKVAKIWTEIHSEIDIKQTMRGKEDSDEANTVCVEHIIRTKSVEALVLFSNTVTIPRMF